jgi:hypothetical protein
MQTGTRARIRQEERDAALGLDVTGAIAWLEDYADRSDWTAIEAAAAAQLDPGWLERHPWPIIVGSTAFPDRMKSPAWALIAFAAPAGFDVNTPFGVVLHNTLHSSVATHAVVCEPRSRLVVELWQRSADRVWLGRRFRHVTRATVERLQNYVALPHPDKVVEHSDLDELGDPLSSLAPLLAAAATGLR